MAPLRTDGSATVVIAGSGLAGLRAAETLRGEGFGGRIVLAGAERHHPYDRPPLSKQYLAGRWGREKLSLRRADAVDELGLDLRLGEAVVACDPSARTVELAGGEQVRWHGLVIASGAVPRSFAGTEHVTGVHVLRTLGDADRLSGALGVGSDADSVAVGGPGPATGRRVVVVGGGFIGTEVAATASELGAAVTIVEPLAAPLARALGPTVGAVCATVHQAHGVDIRTGVGAAALVLSDGSRLPLGSTLAVSGPAPSAPVAAPAPSAPVAAPAPSAPVAAPAPSAPVAAPAPSGSGARVAGVALDDGSVVDADIVVVGIGVVPATDWLRTSGLELGDGVVTDPTLHVADGIVAAGDVARWPVVPTGATVRLEHWTNASEQGVAAARSLLAGRGGAPVYEPVPYVWSDQYDTKIQVIGLPAPDDDLMVVDGDLGSARFVAVLGRGGAVTGAVTFGRPRQLMLLRPLVARRAPMAEAATAFAG